MKASPLAQVQKQFGSKEKLIEAVKGLVSDELWLDKLNEDKGLERVSNRKLLHLHAVLTEVQKEFGSREKLVSALLDLGKRGKDEGFKGRVTSWSTPRLLDAYRAAKKRA
jgi:hypothetical protein